METIFAIGMLVIGLSVGYAVAVDMLANAGMIRR